MRFRIRGDDYRLKRISEWGETEWLIVALVITALVLISWAGFGS